MTPKLALVAVIVTLVACGGETPRQPGSSPGDNPSPAPDTMSRVDTTPRTPDPILIATDLRSYRAGDPVQLRITNTTDTTFTFNPCTRVIEQRAEGAEGWTEIREDRICTMIAHVLEPKSTRTERTELAESLTPGSYRLLILFAPDSPQGARGVRGHTQPISVTP